LIEEKTSKKICSKEENSKRPDFERKNIEKIELEPEKFGYAI